MRSWRWGGGAAATGWCWRPARASPRRWRFTALPAFSSAGPRASIMRMAPPSSWKSRSIAMEERMDGKRRDSRFVSRAWVPVFSEPTTNSRQISIAYRGERYEVHEVEHGFARVSNYFARQVIELDPDFTDKT